MINKYIKHLKGKGEIPFFSCAHTEEDKILNVLACVRRIRKSDQNREYKRFIKEYGANG